MALLKVLVCFLLVTVALAEEEDDGQYDPAKYEAPFMTPEVDDGSNAESRQLSEPVKPETPVESPVKPAESPVKPAETPAQSAESPAQPAESLIQPAVSLVQSGAERLSEISKPFLPSALPNLPTPMFPSIPSSNALPLPASPQSIFPFGPQQISSFVPQQLSPFQPQQVAPFIYSAPQVLRIAADAFPSVTA